MINFRYAVLAVIFILLNSCSKDTSFNELDIIATDEGLLRIECNNCEVNYSVNKKEFNVHVNGSNDIPFYYSGDFDLKTKVISKEDQNIRIMVVDSYGRIVSNELNKCKEGQISKNNFAIKSK